MILDIFLSTKERTNVFKVEEQRRKISYYSLDIST